MSVELIGVLQSTLVSPIHAPTGPIVQPEFMRRVVRAHEDAGFDKVLIGYGSVKPDPFQIAAFGAANSDRLGFLIAHRPGFTSPTLAARQMSTLDQVSNGRLAVNIVTGGNDAEQRTEGDRLSKDERYARTDEYIEALKTIWRADGPVSYEGAFYSFEGYRNAVPCLQDPHVEIYFGGASEAAYRVAGKHADVFMQAGEPLAGTAENIAAVRAEAARHGRTPRFSASFHPILGATEQAAWARAHDLLEQVSNPKQGTPWATMMATMRAGKPTNVGSLRKLRAAEAGERHDRAMWTGLTLATGGFGSHTPLVGTPETVAQALLDYVDIGVTALQLFGYDGSSDPTEYNEALLPILRSELAARERRSIAS